MAESLEREIMDQKEATQTMEKVISDLTTQTRTALEACQNPIEEIYMDLTFIRTILGLEEKKQNVVGIDHKLWDISEQIGEVRTKLEKRK